MILMGIEIEMMLWDNHSLKAKRKIIKSMIDKIHHHYKISAAEVARNDSLDYAHIGVGVVSSRKKEAEKVLNRVIRMIEEEYPVEIINTSFSEGY